MYRLVLTWETSVPRPGSVLGMVHEHSHQEKHLTGIFIPNYPNTVLLFFLTYLLLYPCFFGYTVLKCTYLGSPHESQISFHMLYDTQH